MAAHARTLDFDKSLFFAVSLKVFEVQKSIRYHFETIFIIYIYDSKMIEGQMVPFVIIELGGVIRLAVVCTG